MAVKVAIIYYSMTGTIYQIAQAAQAGAESAGAEVRLRKVTELAPEAVINSNPGWRAHVDATQDVPEASLEDLEWADAYLIGTPTRFGNIATQLRQFIDTTGGLWLQGKLANKVAAAFTSAQQVHGGQETTLLALHNTFYHWGCIIVAPGYTDPAVFANGGNPYGVSSVYASRGEISDSTKAAARHLAQRAVEVAGWIKNGQQKRGPTPHEFLFNILDVDQNGEISWEEYSLFLSTYAVKEDQHKAIFQKLDLDGNGVISRDEWMAAADQFESDDPRDWLLGSS